MRTNTLISIAVIAAAFTFASCDDEATTPNPEVIAFTERQLDVTPGYALPAEAEAVDLGLSVKWANMNIGQTEASFGDRFAWGETDSKTNYSWDTYEFTYQSFPLMLNHYVFGDLQKYNDGTKPGDNLHKNDDVAYVMWGEGWRMPTVAEIDELLSLDVEVNYVKKIVRFVAKNGNHVDFLSSDKTVQLWTSTIMSKNKITSPTSTMAHFYDMTITDYDPKNEYSYKDEFVKVSKYEALGANVYPSIAGDVFANFQANFQYRSNGLYVRPVKK